MCTSIILLTLSALSIAWTPSIEVYIIQSAAIGCFYVAMFHPLYCIGKLTLSTLSIAWTPSIEVYMI